MFNKKSKQIKDLSNKNYKLEKELQSIKTNPRNNKYTNAMETKIMYYK